MTTSAPDVPHSRENAVRFFREYVANNKSKLEHKTVIDLSAGSGYIINEFHRAGAHVQLFDLFPEQNTFCPEPCKKIDLQKELPLAPQSTDFVILAETIEHLPNQALLFAEVSRLLKPGGTFLLTTPNSSSLRSRFSQFLMESEHYATSAPTEVNAFTRWPGRDDGYYSKLFISGFLRLRTLAALHDLRINRVYPSPRSSTSWLLMIFFPFIYYFSRRNLTRGLQEHPEQQATYRDIFKYSTSLDMLLGKHLLVEFTRLTR